MIGKEKGEKKEFHIAIERAFTQPFLIHQCWSKGMAWRCFSPIEISISPAANKYIV